MWEAAGKTDCGYRGVLPDGNIDAGRGINTQYRERDMA
jgi:hypothetical protein